jgi:PEP-CTERM motif
MKAISVLASRTHRPFRLRYLSMGFLPLAAAIMSVACAPGARADLIEKYNLDMTANVSGYNNGARGPFITVSGQFLYDATLGYITSVNLNATGTLLGGFNLPAGGVALNTARTGNEDANDLSAQSADGNYQIRFEFANPLTSIGTFDSVVNTPGTDNGDAQFFDAYAGSTGDTTYHIGYYGVTGGAVPEPASILLLGSSVLGLAFIRRRALRPLA